MPERIQRQRTKGWRMPFVVRCGHAYRVMGKRSFVVAQVSRMWWFGGQQASGWMPNGPTLRALANQATAKQCVPARATSGRPRGGHRLPQGPRESHEQGRTKPEMALGVSRGALREAWRRAMRALWLCGCSCAATGPRGWGRQPASKGAGIGDGLLPRSFQDVCHRTSGDVPGALRQLQRNQTRRTRRMAVASCQ